jgi:hypothetical protein
MPFVVVLTQDEQEMFPRGERSAPHCVSTQQELLTNHIAAHNVLSVWI